MEGELWKEAYRLARQISKGSGVIRGRYSDAEIVAVYFWSVVHDRPIAWACIRSNWRGRQIAGRLPSASTMTRRLRTMRVRQLIQAIEQQLIRSRDASLFRCIDAKPLTVSGHSSDRDTGYGRAASSMARGYKFHGIYEHSRGFVQWTVEPMNVNESPVAAKLISNLDEAGYLVPDSIAEEMKVLLDCFNKG